MFLSKNECDNGLTPFFFLFQVYYTLTIYFCQYIFATKVFTRKTICDILEMMKDGEQYGESESGKF